MTDTTNGAAGEPREDDVIPTPAAAESAAPVTPETSAAATETASLSETPAPEAESTDAPAPVAPATPAAPAAPAAAAPAAAAPVAAPAAAAPAAAPAAPAAPTPAPAPAATGTVYEPGQEPQPYSAPQYTKQPTQPTQPVAAASAAPAQPGQVPPAFGGPAAPQNQTQPTVPLNGVPAAGTAPAAPKQRRVGLGVAAAIVAAALIGGASGAGINALLANDNGAPTSDAANSAQNIVVNDTDSVNQITAVAAKASPSVVTISVSGGQAGGTGSGIILSDDGYVLTNTHVVTLDGATGDPTIQVKTNDGHLYTAELVGTDPLSDLAVIKLVDASGLTPLEFADSDKLNVGDTAIAIGAPLGLSGTVTNGIVSALNRSIDVASSAAPTTPDDSQGDGGDQGGDGGDGSDSPFDFFFDLPDPEGGETPQQPSASAGQVSLPVIQTDAAINPGNSGGALVDSDGKLIGVNVAILSTGGAAQGETAGNIGVGFAVPSNLAKRIADEIIENGSATHGLLGATVTSAEAEGSSDTVGALISEAPEGGAAAAAGLQSGDVVTEFNGVPITDQTDLTAQVRALPGGAKAELTFTRDGESQTVSVTLGTFEG
ncbi:PDZ domain-containing protein [Agromyces fucosus]|uniref:PDZ domain-containing protein n=1 Tax=Agromyces fucosus TaxID=41985 RepID=A0A4Q2JKL8_9MICO|nr:trypsin-like peptidase domain-containing protein [Agromyces fucosus]RXZ46590.1 PDZ domain-containing protein [Agromyces fucosus]